MTAVRLTEGPDLGGVWHYGDPLREQRLLACKWDLACRAVSPAARD